MLCLCYLENSMRCRLYDKFRMPIVTYPKWTTTANYAHDSAGQITKWDYDGLNRLSKKTYGDGKSQTYAYGGGRLLATRDGRGLLTGFSYDANGNLTGIDYPTQTDIALSYNALDKPLSMTDALGTTAFAYDNAGRLTSVDGPWQNDTLSYAYDAEGRRQSLNVQKPNGTNDSTGYGYDGLSRLASVTSSAGTFGYSYQGNTGRVTQLLMPNGTKTLYGYTALGELASLHNQKSDGTNISRYAYSYDARGVRTALQEQIEADPVKTLLFSYDVTGQLTGEQVTGGNAGEAYTSSYQYDSAGNRTRLEKTNSAGATVARYSNNALNQTTAVKTQSGASTSGLSYDDAGNLAQVTSAGGNTSYSFDDANRLTGLITKNAAGLNQTRQEFVYDGMSRLRISRNFTWQNNAWLSQGETRRIYDGLNSVQERDGTGALVATYTRGADMGGGIGGLLSRSFSGSVSFMHYDGRGNVVQLSDAAGAVSGRYTYDAFGNTLSSTGGAAGLNPFRFSTKEHIAGLVYYGYRFYSPSLGKWINRDPLKEQGGTNLYRFVGNNPSNFIDPDGRFALNLIAAYG